MRWSHSPSAGEKMGNFFKKNTQGKRCEREYGHYWQQLLLKQYYFPLHTQSDLQYPIRSPARQVAPPTSKITWLAPGMVLVGTMASIGTTFRTCILEYHTSDATGSGATASHNAFHQSSTSTRRNFNLPCLFFSHVLQKLIKVGYPH